MLDFPASPTVGQIFQSPAGSTWSWDGVKWTPQTASAPVLSGNVGRNLLHNPTFTVAQRGAGPFNSAGYNLDRWQAGAQTGSSSVSQITLTDADRAAIGDEAAKFAYQNVCTGTAGASDYVQGAYQYIEDLRRLSGKTVTVSFWARATSGTPQVGLELYQSFGTGGSPSGAVVGIGSQAFTLSTTWRRYTSTAIALPSVAGKTIGTNANDSTSMVLWQSSGTTYSARAGGIGVQSYTLQLWGVQLEIGAQATPLEKPDPQQDLAKCQRFYQVGTMQLNAYGATGATNAIRTPLPVTMRAAPTMTMLNPNYANASGGAISSPAPYAVIFTYITTATGACGAIADYTASADL